MPPPADYDKSMRQVQAASGAALFLLLAPLLSFAQSPLTISDLVPLTGGGSWFNSLGDSGISAWGAGSYGDEWVSFNYSCDFGGQALVAATVGLSGACSGHAYIGDDTSNMGSQYFSISVFGDFGSLELFDSSRDVMASVSLTGYVVPLQQSVLFNEEDGTFAIVASPEPGTILLVAAAGLAIGVRHRLLHVRDALARDPDTRPQQNR